MTRSILTTTALLLAGVATAAPLQVTHQGRVLDPAGGPVNGAVELEFALYATATGTAALWTETTPLTLEDGYYTTTLGQTVPLTTELFASDSRWLQVSADGQSLGRQPIASTPFALQAATSTNLNGGTVNASSVAINGTVVIDGSGTFVGAVNVPSLQARVTGTCAAGFAMAGINADGSVSCTRTTPAGLVGFFVGGCPTGFVAYAPAQGRAVLGLAPGGTVGATVGTALPAAGTRTITQVPSHLHSIDPSAATTSSAGNHGHSASTGTAGNHGHAFYTATHDTNSSASQGYPNGAQHVAFRTTDRRQETRDNGNIQANGNHTHSVAVATAGAHTHTVDLPAQNTTPTGTASVDVTMPYVQLTSCVSQ